MDTASTETGVEVFVSKAEVERGSKGPFFVTYLTPDSDVRYGFYCGNCTSLDVAMDTMGRLVCSACGNTKKPDEWDAAQM